MLGRILGQPPAGPSRDVSRNFGAANRANANDRSALPADAVVKQRIERQIRATLGDKLQSVEVRVSGKNVLIVARPSRFWQKRGVRRSLETLPILSGYRARIELDN
jgi:hypothetical protein